MCISHRRDFRRKVFALTPGKTFLPVKLLSNRRIPYYKKKDFAFKRGSNGKGISCLVRVNITFPG